jgi:glycosyltransferase involved in cell wall biosynthesis
MRIIGFVNRNSGPSYHRIIMPLMLMDGPEVFITNNLLEEHFDKGCDIFMYNRILPAHAQDMLSRLKEKHGFKTVVDVDDYWYLDPSHVLYDIYEAEEFAKQQVSHIILADAVITTHERLAEEVRLYNPNVYVCPNAIPRQGQFDIQRSFSEFTRLFWQGSDTHQEDILMLERAINRLGPISKKIKMVIAGYSEDSPPWGPIVECYTAGLKHQYKIILAEPVTDYYKAYKEADICLIPLVNNKFNRMKSNLKVLEAANMSIPVVASAAHPYLDLPINYCKNSGEWISHIKRLVNFPARRIEEGKKLSEFCNEYFNFKKINNERRQVLEHVAVKQYEPSK